MLCLHSVPLSALQRKGQTVLVTAAAGGTGQIAVQLAVMAGCHVVGTCSGGDKERLLR
jgi:NADPH-dependent curcumin reductase CurA